MSIIQKIITSNPKSAQWFMTSMPANFWVRQGENKILDAFHDAAEKVPAYKKFLKKNNINHLDIETIDDYKKKVPLTSKKSYLHEYYPEDLIFGTIADSHTFYTSGGTTGKSILDFGSREAFSAYPQGLAGYFDYFWDICDPEKKVLIVNTMTLGAWLGGTLGSLIFYEFSKKYKNITFFNVGADADMAINILMEKVGKNKFLYNEYDIVILVSYPTFMKEIIYQGDRRGLDWKSVAIKVVTSGEILTENFRDFLRKKLSKTNDPYMIMDQYGATEVGNPGADTPMTNKIKAIAVKNKKLCRDIFGDEIPKTLVQNNPMNCFVEIVNDKIIVSKQDKLPTFRYHPSDLGRYYSWEEMNKILKQNNIDIVSEMKKDGWSKPLFKWPFLVVQGRSDYAISIFGAKISPQSVAPVFTDDLRIHAFQIAVEDDDILEKPSKLTIYLELQPGISLSTKELGKMESYYSEYLLGHLLESNCDFKDAFSIHKTYMNPHIKVHQYREGPFTKERKSFKPHAIKV